MSSGTLDIEINFEKYNKVNSKLKPLLKKLASENKLNIITNSQVLMKEFQDIKLNYQKIINDINKNQINLKSNIDITYNLSAVEEFRTKMSELNNITDETNNSNNQLTNSTFELGGQIVNVCKDISAGVKLFNQISSICGKLTLFESFALDIGIFAESLGIASEAAFSLGVALSAIIPVAVIIGGIAVFEKLHVSIQEQQEKVDELEGSYNKLNDELSRLKEIQSPTEADKNRISDLETEIEYQKILLDIENKKLAKKKIEGNSSILTYDDLPNKLGRVQNDIKKTIKTLDTYNNLDISAIKDPLIKDSIDNQVNKAKTKLIEFSKQQKQIIEDTQSYSIIGEDIPEDLQNMIDQSDGLEYLIRDTLGLAKAEEKLTYEYNSRKITLEAYNEEMRKLKQSQLESEKGTENSYKSQKELNQIYTQASEIFNDFYSNTKSLSSIYNDLNNGNKLSASTLSSLIEQYPQYTQQILNANTSKENGIKLAKLLFEAERNSAVKNLEIKKQQLEEEKKLYDFQINSLQSQLENGFITSSIFNSLMNKAPKFDNTQIDALTSQIDLIKSMNFDDLIAENKSSTKTSNSNDLIQIDDTYLSIEEKLEEINYQLERQKLLSEQSKGTDKADFLIKQIDLMKEYQDELHNINEKRREVASQKAQDLISGLGLSQSDMKIEYDENGQLKNIIFDTDKINQKLKSISEKNPELASQLQDMFNTIQDTTSAISDASLEWIQYNNSIKDTEKELSELNKEAYQNRLDNVSEVENKIIEIIKKREEIERDELEKTHNEKIDNLEDEHKTILNGYKEELDKYKNMINDKKDALNKQYEEEEYQEGLSKLNDEESIIQKQINELKLRDDIEAKTKTIELEKQLSDKHQEIAEYQRDREKELLLSGLDEQLCKQEEYYQFLENEENLRYEGEKLRLNNKYEKEKQYLDSKYSDQSIYFEAQQALIAGQVEYIDGQMLTLTDAYNKFENEFGDGMSFLGSQIKSEFIDKIEDALDMVNKLRESSSKINKATSSTKRSSNIMGSETPVKGYVESNLVGIYDRGTTYVPRTGKAIIHEGEAIIPKANNPFINLNASKYQGFMQHSLNLRMPQFKELQTFTSGSNYDININVAGNLDRTILPNLNATMKKVIKEVEIEKFRKARSNGLYR